MMEMVADYAWLLILVGGFVLLIMFGWQAIDIWRLDRRISEIESRLDEE